MLAILDKKMSIKRDTTLWTEPQVDAKRELHHCRHLDQENIRPAEDRQLSEREFYVRAKAICRDLFEINAKRYWIDFLLSTTAAYICASIFLASSSASIVGWLAFAAAVVLIYRGSMFIHEIVHLPSNKLKVFRRVWNFYAGVPMLVPTSTYQSHIHHHNSNHYGTDQDGEYLPFAHGTFWGIGVYLCQIVFQPLLVYARYLLGRRFRSCILACETGPWPTRARWLSILSTVMMPSRIRSQPKIRFGSCSLAFVPG